MRMVDLIEKKKCGLELTSDEISFIIKGIMSGEIPDYQMSAFLMAVCFQGMTDQEATSLTFAMRDSGKILICLAYRERRLISILPVVSVIRQRWYLPLSLQVLTFL